MQFLGSLSNNFKTSLLLCYEQKGIYFYNYFYTFAQENMVCQVFFSSEKQFKIVFMYFVGIHNNPKLTIEYRIHLGNNISTCY